MTPTPVHIPRVNPNDDVVELLRKGIADGEAVNAGDPIGEIATTKAAVVLETPAAGFLKWKAAEGDELAVGATVAEIHATAEACAAAGAGAGASEAATPAPAFKLSPGAARCSTAERTGGCCSGRLSAARAWRSSCPCYGSHWAAWG